MRKRRTVYILIIIIPIALIVIWFVRTRMPVKYAIKMEDVGQYQDCILVKEAWHTGTGWEQVGNDNGYLPTEQKKDVYLTGNTPPTANIGGKHINTFLCEVIYLGQSIFPAYETAGDETLFDKYEVLEWYPIYPVKRDTFLPSWFYSRDYLSRSDKV